MRLFLAIALTIALAGPGRGAAADAATAVFGANGDDIVLELGGGGKVRPAYEGADDYTGAALADRLAAYPAPAVSRRVRRRAGNGALLRALLPLRAGARRRRSSGADRARRRRLAFELGGTLGYRTDMLRGFVTLRQGFGGHDGTRRRGRPRCDRRADARASVSLGPRLHFAERRVSRHLSRRDAGARRGVRPSRPSTRTAD